MNAIALVFFTLNAVALVLLPQRWASLPLLIGACYVTLGKAFELGPFHFPFIRILILVGLVRVCLRNERVAGRINGLDTLMICWAAWAIVSSFFHEDIDSILINRLGLVFNAIGIYFLIRAFCRSVDDVVVLCRAAAILVIPLSFEMYYEHLTGRNLFYFLGGPEFCEVRGGIVRAQGPFAHSILAGSVAAGCLPLMFGIWRKHRTTSLAGMVACGTMIYTSASSGPVLSAAFALLAMATWPLRQHMRLVRWFFVLAYVALDIVMKAPPYYLLARIDLTGNSTSWHRPALIEAAGKHFDEWWLGGTDHTRHWMDYGVGWSANHVDITNYYIMMGVNGGLLLMLLFVACLAMGFAYVGKRIAHTPPSEVAVAFLMWTLGAALFAHAATFVSISYFDQSVVFLYLTLAMIASAQGGATVAAADAGAAEPSPSAFRYLPLPVQSFAVRHDPATGDH